MIEVSESKVSKMSEYAEDALHAMGRLMSCLSALESGYGERSGESGRSMMGNRGSYDNRYDDEMDMRGYGSRMNYRDEDDDEDFGERRGRRRRDSMGRYR